MKKILALTLTGMLALGGGGAVIASAQPAPENLPAAQESVAEKGKLYLVPGTYIADGIKVENTVDGAQKLAAEECDAIFTENAYVCTLAEGAALPAPASEREGYSFNGWWTISDATVTYFDKVPALTETTFLYADWRADLSQRKDPIEPNETTTVKPQHYMSITRAATGETEIITMRVSGAVEPTAVALGYGRPVQLYNGWFELCPGDKISVYTVGLGEEAEAQLAPLDVTGRKITLENSGDGANVTGSYITASTATAELTYRKVLKTRHFRIYVKFYSKGSEMAVYLEPMD